MIILVTAIKRTNTKRHAKGTLDLKASITTMSDVRKGHKVSTLSVTSIRTLKNDVRKPMTDEKEEAVKVESVEYSFLAEASIRMIDAVW